MQPAIQFKYTVCDVLELLLTRFILCHTGDRSISGTRNDFFEMVREAKQVRFSGRIDIPLEEKEWND